MAWLLEELSALNADLAVPSTRSHGISEARWFEVVPEMARQALASGSPGNNPRVPQAAEIEKLYAEAYG